MIDRNSIPLAEGSRWSRANRDKTTVRDHLGELTYIENGCLTLNNSDTVQYSDAADALACLTAAGLNPYAEALERLATAALSPNWDVSDEALAVAMKLLGRTT